MSSRNKYGKFKKKDYVRIIRAVRDYLCETFGYKMKPSLFETRLSEGCLMEFFHGEKWFAVLYDYKQFKDRFGHHNFEVQNAYAAAMAAHEIRHYYQHRQMIAVKPKESEKTIALWRECELSATLFDENGGTEEYYLQPLELDAFLFEYVFAAKEFGLLLLQSIANERHLDCLEALYVEYFGKTDETLFGREIREALREARSNSDQQA